MRLLIVSTAGAGNFQQCANFLFRLAHLSTSPLTCSTEIQSSPRWKREFAFCCSSTTTFALPILRPPVSVTRRMNGIPLPKNVTAIKAMLQVKTSPSLATARSSLVAVGTIHSLELPKSLTSVSGAALGTLLPKAMPAVLILATVRLRTESARSSHVPTAGLAATRARGATNRETTPTFVE